MAVDKLLVVQILHTQIGVYSIVRVDIQQILDGTTFRILSTFGDFVYLQPVTLTFLCKEHHGIMHGCRINMLYKVCIAGFGTFGAYPTTVLRTEFAQRCAFDVSHVRDGDNHFIICIEVFRIEFF